MKKLLFKCFAVTIFVFLMMLGLSAVSNLKIFNAFDPISTALAEFELTDYVFSKIRETPNPEQRIVLVNIGPSRRAIAQQISLISEFHPKVIGVDTYFNCEGGDYDTVSCPQLLDTLGNLLLSDAIQRAGNVVLVSRILQSDALAKSKAIDVYDSIEYSDSMFSDYAQNGFANVSSGATYQEDVKICKSFYPRMKVGDTTEIAFAVKLAAAYDSAKANVFLKRDKEEEIINFIGNADIQDVKINSIRESMDYTSDFRLLCYALDYEDLMTGQFVPEMFKDNIVIMGYLGDYFGDTSWEDKWYTPLNTKVAGRANPDMFGVVIHANIVTMILRENYVNELGDFVKFLIAFVICMVNVVLFNWVDKRFPIWFDGLSVLIQIVEILLVSGLIVAVFTFFTFKLDLTLTMVAMALVGPCFDVYKSLESSALTKFTNWRKRVSTPKSI